MRITSDHAMEGTQWRAGTASDRTSAKAATDATFQTRCCCARLSLRLPARPRTRMSAPLASAPLPLLCDVWEGRGKKGSKAVKSEFSATSPIVLKGNCNGGRARIEGEHEDRLMS